MSKMHAERKGCSRISNMLVTPLGVDCDAATRPEVLSSESG
jgi:hypothetical protein